MLGDPAAATSAPFLALAAKHEEILKVYRSGRFDEAASLMAEARALGETWHLEKLYDLYAGHLEGFRTQPPPPGWDGVFTATSK